MSLSRLIVIFFIFCSTLSADHVRWYGNYDKALSEAKKQNKPLMIVVRKKDCKPCQKMFEITFKDQPYIKQINQKYISLIVTFGDKISYPIEMLYTRTFPALFFVSSKNELFLGEPFFGFVEPSELSGYIDEDTN